MVYPIFCLLKGQQNGLWLWWMMNEVKGGKGEPVRVVAVPMPMTRYDMLHAQRAACSSGSSDPMAWALPSYPQPLLFGVIRYIYQGSTYPRCNPFSE